MLIFTFCENAVKHGLYPKKGEGFLHVSCIQQKSTVILITIKDNGIGRKMSNKAGTKGTGMGLPTLKKIIKYYNGYNINTIGYNIADKADDGGTIVIVKIRRLT